MSTERFERIQQIFHQALELEVEQRPAFVAEACSDDEEMREEVLALLGAEANPATMLDTPLSSLVDIEEDSLEGQTLGAYRLLGLIGSGGMGNVYLAERSDGSFERQVALKVVKKGMDSEAVVRRFEMERQILARLDHPNIARLLDGGLTDDGRPYFVMEYVEGKPITDYCDEQRLSVNARLQLFQKICDAVQFAHQSLVVHRDLKPSNILVNADGEVRLLDFGIAKLLDDSDDPELTAAGDALLTPAYAAPEQLQSDSVTTMTDVYSLGVVLYELLVGRRPFEPRKSVAEYREEVLSGELARPSTAVTQLLAGDDGKPVESTAQTVAGFRGVPLTRLQAQLRGDLDTICLMALQREPDRRYASAEQFGADLQRFMEGRPVLARVDSLGYRLAKYLRRHRAGVIGTTLAVLVLVTMSAYYTVQLARERDLALDEQRKANEVVQFVLGLFDAADPALARGADVTARELLDAGAERVRVELADRPTVQASMMRVLGNVYHEIGMTDEGGDLLERALAAHLELYGDLHAETATTELSLGILNQSVGNFERAGELLQQSLDSRVALTGAESAESLEALSALAFFNETIGDYAAAEELHLRSLELARQIADGQDDAYLAQAMARLAGLYRLLDRPDEAEPLLRDALAMQDRVYGGPHPESDETKRQLAELLTNQNLFEEAEALFLELIDSRTKMMGPDHYELGSVWNSYGHLLALRGDIPKAIEAYETMLRISEKAYGGVHPSLAAGYNNIAILYRNRGDFADAAERYQRSLDMQTTVGLAEDHPNRSFPMAGLGSVYLLQKEYVLAEQTLQAALEIRRKHFDETHRLISEIKSDLAAVLMATDREAEAEAMLLEIYPLFMDGWGPEDARTRRAAGRLVMLYEQLGEPQRADPYREIAWQPEEDIMLR